MTARITESAIGVEPGHPIWVAEKARRFGSFSHDGYAIVTEDTRKATVTPRKSTVIVSLRLFPGCSPRYFPHSQLYAPPGTPLSKEDGDERRPPGGWPATSRTGAGLKQRRLLAPPSPQRCHEIDYAGRSLFRIEQADLGQFDSRRLDDILLPRLGLFSNSFLGRQLLLILPLLKPALLGPLLAAFCLTLLCHPLRLCILCPGSGVVLGSGGLRSRSRLCRNSGGLRSLLDRGLRRRSFGRSFLGRLRIGGFLLRLRLLLLRLVPLRLRRSLLALGLGLFRLY